MAIDEVTTRRPRHRWRAGLGWQVAALALVMTVSAYLLTAPIFQPETECSSGGSYSSTGELISSWDTCESPRSILAAGHLLLIAWLVLPVLLAALPLVARSRLRTVLSAVSAIALVAYVMLGGFALGPLFVPGAGCAVVGAIVCARSAPTVR